MHIQNKIMNNIVAIVGRPNVGKSTFFNRLIQRREAIVDSVSGVTRDRNYGKSEWNGKEFSVIDTGGYIKGSDDIFEAEIRRQVELAIDEADAIITYNGKRFDMPTLNREFLLQGFKPPSPYKDIDLLQTARNKFKFASNKLDYIAQELGVGQKTSHEGMPLWIECMSKNPKAWKLIKKYNCNYVRLTEQVYLKLQGWITIHPNHNLYHKNNVCPNCGSHNLQKRGVACNTKNMYQRFQCQGCGKWSRLNIPISKLKPESVISI